MFRLCFRSVNPESLDSRIDLVSSGAAEKKCARLQKCLSGAYSPRLCKVAALDGCESDMWPSADSLYQRGFEEWIWP